MVHYFRNLAALIIAIAGVVILLGTPPQKIISSAPLNSFLPPKFAVSSPAEQWSERWYAAHKVAAEATVSSSF